jgi:hypothetical protein
MDEITQAQQENDDADDNTGGDAEDSDIISNL